VAPIQVVFITVPPKKQSGSEDEVRAKNNAILDKAHELSKQLKALGVRVKVDDSTNKTPAYKHNHWTLRGVPVRVVLGSQDYDNAQVTVKQRFNDEFEETLGFDDVASRLLAMLGQIHDSMYARAVKERDECLAQITEWKYFMPELDKGKMLLVPFCNTVEAEEWIKQNSKGMEGAEGQSAGAKSLCIPFEQPAMPPGQMCITGQGPARVWCLFGRSY